MEVFRHAVDLEKLPALTLDEATDLLIELLSPGGQDQRLPVLGAEDDVIDQSRAGVGGQESVDGLPGVGCVIGGNEFRGFER